MRLWLLLTLVVDGLILLGAGSYGVYMADMAVEERLQDKKRDTLTLARSIAFTAGDDLILGNYDKIENRLLRMVTISSARDLQVFDRAGLSVVHVTRKSDNDAPAVNYAVATPALDLSRREMLVPDDYYTVLEPVGQASSPVGWVRVSVGLSHLAQARQDIWWSTLLAALATALAVSLILALILHRITASLRTATEFSAGLAHHLGASLPARGGILEINQLQRSLNDASRTLSAQHQALQDSEQRKAAMLEANLDCLVTMDQDGRIVDFNPAAEATFGWSSANVTGERLGDILVPAVHRAAHEQGMRHYLATGEGPVLRKRIEVTALRRDGSEFPVELTIVPFRGGGKQFFLGSLRDISVRKMFESERERITAQLEQAVKDMAAIQLALDQHAIVSKADAQGNITYANDKFLQISGYSSEEVLGRNHRFLKSGLHEDRFYEGIWATIATGEVWHGDIANRRKGGETYWVASTIVPMPGEDGLPQQYISVRTDITEQKRTESNLESARQGLQTLVEKYRLAELEIAQARARELDIGSQIQRTLLFGNVPARFGPLVLAGHSEASKGIDGDFYEFFSYSEGLCDVSLGDVMGKGIPAALIGAAVKRQLSQVMAAELVAAIGTPGIPEPDHLINALHHHVTPQLFALESFVTLAYLRFDVARRVVSLVSAGHLPVLAVGQRGMRWLSGDNLPLGVLADELYVQREYGIETDELLFIYSDGYTEACSPEGIQFGAERLCEIVSEMQAANLPVVTLLQAVRKAIHDFEQTSVPSDDRTCIAIRCHGSAADAPSELELPWTLDALGSLRQFIDQRARQAGLADEACDALILAAVEAATNVIRHVTPALVDASVLVRVADTPASVEVSFYYIADPYVPSARAPDFSGESEGGFGLYIIDNSVDAVTYDSPAAAVARIHLCKHKSALPPNARNS